MVKRMQNTCDIQETKYLILCGWSKCCIVVLYSILKSWIFILKSDLKQMSRMKMKGVGEMLINLNDVLGPVSLDMSEQRIEK